MIVQLFDTETTGLFDNRTLPLKKLPHIIEWYSCVGDLETGEVISEYEQLIKPPIPISDESVRITGITDAMVADAPMFPAVADRIRDIIENGPRMIAHNASYDIEMTEIEFERLGQTVTWPKRPLCTVEASVSLKGFRLNLTSLHEHLFGKGFPEAHRAKNDVMALFRCACELYKMGEL